MILILYIFLLSLPTLLSLQYVDKYYLYFDYLVATSLIALSIFLIGRNIQNKTIRMIFSIFASIFVSLVFVADLYSFYLQGESFNNRFFYHLQWDVIKTGASAYPQIFIGVIALLFINALASFYVVVWDWKKKAKISKSFHYSCLMLCTVSLVSFSNPIGNLTTQAKQYYYDYSSTSILSPNSNQNLPENLIAKPGKNLVLIYLESLEKNYLDPSIFPELTPNLNQLSQQGVFLDNFIQKTGSEYTIAGLFSSQCGLPLISKKLHSNGNDIFSSRNYNTPCLGDILKKAGYQNVYYGGADSQFAGKGNFLNAHGYDEIYGLRNLEKKLPFDSRIHSWGIHDYDVYNLALERYRELSESQKPFNLTVLTLDTHHPDGHPDKRCPTYENEPNNSMLSAVHCSDYLVGKFIEGLKQESAWNNTIVMIMSDHLAMRNVVEDQLKQKSPRLLTGLILNSDLKNGFYSEPMYHVDVADTLLNSMNIDHNHEFLMSYNLLDRLGNNEHPPTYFDSSAKMLELQSYLRGLSQTINISNSSIDFSLKQSLPLIKFGQEQLLLTNFGVAKLDENNIYMINIDNNGNLYTAEYIGQKNLSNKIYLLDDGISLFVTKTKNLSGTGFEYLYKSHPKDWVAFIGKRGHEGYANFASSFKRLKISHKIVRNIIKQQASEIKLLPRIAHAGGGFMKYTYTNSIEALDHNYELGFRYFELDFSWTSDQHLVCIHDWNRTYQKYFSQTTNKIPSLLEFKELVKNKSKFNKCTFDSLTQWLNKHPDSFIVTDIKSDNLKGLQLIAQKYPQYIDRFIPQIYQPEEYKEVSELGFKNMIWTLYLYRGDEESIISFAKKNLLYAVTMPVNIAKSGLAAKLKDLGIYSYAHTINDGNLLKDLLDNYEVSNIYTDYLRQ